MSDYVPTTDEVIRSFSIPAHRVVERKDGESFADYLSRASIETHKSQTESEAAARRWLAEHDAQLVEKLADEVPNTVGTGGHARSYIQHWLRARADRIEKGESND